MGSTEKERLFARLFFWVKSKKDPQREIAFRVHANTEDNKRQRNVQKFHKVAQKLFMRDLESWQSV